MKEYEYIPDPTNPRVPTKYMKEFINIFVEEYIETHPDALTEKKKIKEDMRKNDKQLLLFIEQEDENGDFLMSSNNDDDDEDDDDPMNVHWRDTANWIEMIETNEETYYGDFANPSYLQDWCCNSIAFSDAEFLSQEFRKFIKEKIDTLQRKVNRFKQMVNDWNNDNEIAKK